MQNLTHTTSWVAGCPSVVPLPPSGGGDPHLPGSGPPCPVRSGAGRLILPLPARVGPLPCITTARRFAPWRTVAGLLMLAVFALLPTVAQAQIATTFVSNTGQIATAAGYYTDTQQRAQQFTTGDHAGGYTLSEVVVDIGRSCSITPAFALHRSTTDGGMLEVPGAKVVDLVGSAASTGKQSFSPATATSLARSTKYFVLFRIATAASITDCKVSRTISSDVDHDAASGWDIAYPAVFSPDAGQTWTTTQSNPQDPRPPIKIAIRGSLIQTSPPPPPPPTGGGGGGGGGPRQTVPDTPTNVVAEGTDGAVVLTWKAPEDDDGAPITDYEYRIDGKGRWISIGSTDTTHTVTGLVNDTVYVFQVRAVNRVGRSPASDPAEATPRADVALDFAHFANGAGITSEIVLVNVAPYPIRPAIYFYAPGGDLIDPESVMDVTGDLVVTEDGALTVQTEMESVGEFTISTHGRGELVSGSVKVVADGPMGGFLRFNLPDIGVAGVGASPPVRDVLFPARRQAGGINTGVALHNLEEEAMGVSCRLMRGGAVLEEVEILLEANGQTSGFINDVFIGTDTSDFVGSVRCTATGRFTGIALELGVANRIFTTLPVVPVDHTGGRGGETVLDFAQFANGAGITSELVFVNLSIEPSRPAPTPFHSDILPSLPVLYFYDPGGDLIDPASVVDLTGDLVVTEDGALTVQTEIEPLGVLTISTHGRGHLLSGSVKVVSAGPIGGVLRFDLPEVGVAGVGASQPVSNAIVPVRRQQDGLNTGIAIHNLESSPELVRCDLMQEGVRLDAANISLAANGQDARFIDQMFTGTDTSDFVGLVRCAATGEGLFTALALEMDPGNRIFTTLPVVPVEH